MFSQVDLLAHDADESLCDILVGRGLARRFEVQDPFTRANQKDRFYPGELVVARDDKDSGW